MKSTLVMVLLLSVVLTSCKKDEATFLMEQQEEIKKQEQVFTKINNSWSFTAQPITVTSQRLTQDWPEWRTFLKELSQKPKSTLGAFKQKAKTLSTQAATLNTTLPLIYNVPEVRSRIATITTHINSLNLYLHLGIIPEGKVTTLIPAINQELKSVQLQMAEIDQINSIKIEDGEQDMIRMLDTTRAISTN